VILAQALSKKALSECKILDLFAEPEVAEKAASEVMPVKLLLWLMRKRQRHLLTLSDLVL